MMGLFGSFGQQGYVLNNVVLGKVECIILIGPLFKGFCSLLCIKGDGSWVNHVFWVFFFVSEGKRLGRRGELLIDTICFSITRVDPLVCSLFGISGFRHRPC